MSFQFLISEFQIIIPQHRNLYNSQFCEGHNESESQVWYKTCNNVWPAVQTAIRKVHDLRYEIEEIYKEEFPAIIPNYEVGPVKEL